MASRPIDLNLFKIHFPITAVVSILHRASGLLLFFVIPLLLWLLQASLTSEMQWQQIQQVLRDSFWVKGLYWLCLSALTYHVIAGVRHLIMDLGWGDSLQAGRLGAFVVITLTTFSVLGLGVWLWR